MIIMQITVSAPAKIILHGEHAVVYGKNAVAASINLRNYLKLSSNNDGRINLDFPAVEIKRSWSVQKIAEAMKTLSDTNDTREISDKLNSIICKLTGTNTGSHNALLALSVFLFLYNSISCKNGQPPAMDINISSEIPLGAGLGSSASLSVCLVTALLLHQGWISAPKQGQDWEEKDLELINKWAFEGERIMHGKPSGIDNSVATYGGAFMFQAGKITKLEKMPSLRLLVINTRVPRSTKDLVAVVREKFEKYPDVIQPVFDSIEAISKRCRGLYSEMVGPKYSESHFSDLEKLIDLNQGLLQVLGVSHSAIDKICQITSKYGCHSKLTGAGGGGCCFSLLRPDITDDTLRKIKNELSEENFDCWETQLGGKGVEATVVTT